MLQIFSSRRRGKRYTDNILHEWQNWSTHVFGRGWFFISETWGWFDWHPLEFEKVILTVARNNWTITALTVLVITNIVYIFRLNIKHNVRHPHRLLPSEVPPSIFKCEGGATNLCIQESKVWSATQPVLHATGMSSRSKWDETFCMRMCFPNFGFAG